MDYFVLVRWTKDFFHGLVKLSGCLKMVVQRRWGIRIIPVSRLGWLILTLCGMSIPFVRHPKLFAIATSRELNGKISSTPTKVSCTSSEWCYWHGVECWSISECYVHSLVLISKDSTTPGPSKIHSQTEKWIRPPRSLHWRGSFETSGSRSSRTWLDYEEAMLLVFYLARFSVRAANLR